MSTITTRSGETIQNPAVIKWLGSDVKAAWLWLPLRLWLGYKWISAAWPKVNNPAWVQSGEALKGFWTNAVVIPAEGRPPISFDWYRNFLQAMLDSGSYKWFAPFVAYGELLVGIALVLGLFTGLAAFFGGFMNWNYMMAGSASSNPMLLLAAIGLLFAWKVSGYIGLDRYLLPIVAPLWVKPEKGKTKGKAKTASKK